MDEIISLTTQNIASCRYGFYHDANFYSIINVIPYTYNHLNSTKYFYFSFFTKNLLEFRVIVHPL